MDPSGSHLCSSTQHWDCHDLSTVPRPAPKAGAILGMDLNCAQRTQLSEKHFRGWRRVLRNFTPSWFSVNMGTGIVSILLHNLPYNGTWLYWISVAIFCLNVVLFLLFLTASILRYTLYPDIWLAMVRHPAQSLFLGTFPMGLATIVNMIVFVCVPAFGNWAITLVGECHPRLTSNKQSHVIRRGYYGGSTLVYL